MSPHSTRRIALIALWAMTCAVVGGGCASWQLPRIDPSGQRLFIWPNQSPAAPYSPPPSFAAPIGAPVAAPSFTGNVRAAPVYSDVPTAPLAPSAPPVMSTFSNPFTPTVIGPPVAVGAPGAGVPLSAPAPPVGAVPIGQDYLRIAPDRVMAPVGTEVILKASICGANGYLLPDRRVEWLLSRDAAGQFVDLGDRGQVDLFRWVWDTPRKVDNWYAIGSTAYANQVLQRGTPDPSDDVLVSRGEAWISVSSAVEGTSRVTVYTPAVENWQFRQATATIYWIDAQWVFPSSTVAEAGRPHVLTTTVMRRTDGAPLAGWIVRYDVPSGGASLGYASGDHTDVPTDAAGRASVEVSPNDVGGGTATIGVTIIRPAQAGAQPSPQFEVGRGAATITWGSGSSPTPINTSPQLQPTPTPALPSTPAPIGGSSSTAPYTAPPAAAQTGPPRLEARLTNAGPAAAAVGEYVSFELTVTNRGESTARNILVYDRFDVGLSHDGDTAVPKRNAIEYRAMRDLPPGETATVPLTFKVLAAGQHCHEATVSADGAAPVTQSGCITGRQAALQVRLDAVRRQVVGQPAGFTITVRNVGDVPATNIEIIQQFAPSLQAMPAAPEQQLAADGSLRIRIDRLNANEVRQFNTQARCVTPSASAASRATVTVDGGTPQQANAFVEIVP